MNSALRGRLRHLGARVAREDAGTSLMELLVGMIVMGVFMAIFTGAVVSMARTTTKIEAVATSADQVNNAFLALDKLVRYASAVTPTGAATGPSGDWYIELASVDGDTGVETCNQLRVDVASQKLQKRTWTADSPTSFGSLSGWSTLASNITNGAAVAGSADQPFTSPAPLSAASTSLQRLRITLVGTSGEVSPSTTRSSITFNAINSIASDPANAGKCRQLAATELRP